MNLSERLKYKEQLKKVLMSKEKFGAKQKSELDKIQEENNNLKMHIKGNI